MKKTLPIIAIGLMLAASCKKEDNNTPDQQVVCGLTAALQGDTLVLTNHSLNLIDTIKITEEIFTLYGGGGQGTSQSVPMNVVIPNLQPEGTAKTPINSSAHYISISTSEGCSGAFDLSK